MQLRAILLAFALLALTTAQYGLTQETIFNVPNGDILDKVKLYGVKWKAYDGSENGWAFLVGNDLFVPVENRSYNVGDYVYVEFTKL